MTKTSGQLEIERRKRMYQIDIEDLSICHYCKSTGLNETHSFCPNCAFPQRGTQEEMKSFIRKIHDKKMLVEEQKSSVKKARNILYILSGLNLLAGLVLGIFILKNTLVLLGGLLGAIIYLALGLWSRKQPFPSILSGFFVYIVFIAISAINDPSALYRGLLWKAIIISGFVYGFKGVKNAQRLESELEAINNAKDLNSEN